MTSAILIRTPSGLRGSTDVDDSKWRKFKRKLETMGAGKWLRIEWSSPRNGKHHAKFFALLTLIAENSEVYDDVDKALIAVKLVVGHFDLVQHPVTGEISQIPKSIAYESMSQEDFEVFYSRAIDGILAHILPQMPRATMDKLLDHIMLGWG